MFTFIVSYLSSLVILAAVDGAWLYFMHEFYSQHLGQLFGPSVLLFPAVAFYVVYALAIAKLVVCPGLKAPWCHVAVRGGILGLAAYGAYNLTNHATLATWSSCVTAVDLAWGVCATAVVAVASYVITKHIAPCSGGKCSCACKGKCKC